MANDFGVGVRQQGKLDFVVLGEILPDRRTIVADGGQPQSLRFKSFFSVLQPHELRFAEGSPIGGTKKKKDSALRPFESLVGLFMVELIGESERRSRLTDLQANRQSNCMIIGGFFLPTGKTKESDKKGWQSQLSFWLQIPFRSIDARRRSDVKAQWM